MKITLAFLAIAGAVLIVLSAGMDHPNALLVAITGAMMLTSGVMMFGHLEGMDEIRKIAVARGVARWEDDQQTRVVWVDRSMEMLKAHKAGDLYHLQRRAHQIACDKGWHNSQVPVPEALCLIHEEISEALRCHRDGHVPSEIWEDDGKPEGIPVELADAVIRIMDFSALHGIDLQGVIQQKMEYNQTRPHRHGGKVC